MRQEIKDEINVLFLKDVGNLLMKEEINYLIIDKENSVDVKLLPIVHTDYLGVLYDYLAYDYDKLSPLYQDKFKFHFKHLKKDKDGIYHYETKTYTKKNNQ